ncbi:MAG: chromate transporter [Oscillospiraceae bacterium]|jgi:chromate transporter|nr:chromate transporter [Oscillospiraceae bacterium]
MDVLAKLIELFLIFAKIGLFTIGGGLAMIPLIQQELIAKGYMAVQQTMDMVAIANMTPGPFAVNSATFAGMQLYGVSGAAVATLGAIVPSFVICMLVARYFFRFADAPQVQAVMRGIRPIVYALILSGMVSICGTALFPGGIQAMPDLPVLAMTAVLSVLMWKTKINTIWLIAAAGVFGAVFLR